MAIFFWILNAAISAFNAWACGIGWADSRRLGGWTRLVHWMGAVMSASGFTWCLLTLLATAGSHIPSPWTDGPLLAPVLADLGLQLGYLVVIGPILGSGLALTVDAWAAFLRHRSAAHGAVAIYDTVAQFHNIYGAAHLLPDIAENAADLLFDGDGDDLLPRLGLGVVALLVGLVALSLGGGVLLTRAILLATARDVARSDAAGHAADS
jgi:hypothetical protein